MVARFATLIAAIALFAGASACLCSASIICTAPPGFQDIPHPAVSPSEELVSHTEEIVIPRSFLVVSAAMNRPLDEVIAKSDSLPGVAGDYMLTEGSFGAPGSRRIVCLTDGGSTEEEVLGREDAPATSHFRYIVWNYSTPKAKPIAYGVGEFQIVQVDNGHTRITWTYSFKLKESTFPGDLGSLGRWLFKVDFLDRDYAIMMKNVLRGYQITAERLSTSTPLSASRRSQ